MRSFGWFVTPLCLFAVAIACAGTQVENREILVNEKLPRPEHIYVYDFVAAPEDVPSDSTFAGQVSSGSSLSPDQIALGREVGAKIANALISEISAMGLPAAPATDQTRFSVGNLVIRGYLLSVDPGNATERVAIGMGEGAAELRVAVEGFEVTPNGLRKLGSGTIDTKASKTPGSAVPLAVAIATKNPLGLIVNTGVKLHGEATGSSTIEGKAKDVAKEIGEEIRPRFEAQGWIAPE